MKIEGVIFDLDGTLIHTIEDIAGAANRLFDRHGIPGHEVDYYLKWIGNGAKKFIERALGVPVSEEKLMTYLKEFKAIYGEHLHEKSRIYEGIPGVLDKLQAEGIKMAVLSNKPHLLTQRVAAYYLSPWTFTHILGQREEIPRKPDPAAAFEIAEGMGLDPANILFVGDSNNDILTARAAGMVPLGVYWGYGRLRTEAVEGDYRILEEPGEIIPFIKKQA
jgi:phosphoglycolate phosphatase